MLEPTVLRRGKFLPEIGATLAPDLAAPRSLAAMCMTAGRLHSLIPIRMPASELSDLLSITHGIRQALLRAARLRRRQEIPSYRRRLRRSSITGTSVSERRIRPRIWIYKQQEPEPICFLTSALPGQALSGTR